MCTSACSEKMGTHLISELSREQLLGRQHSLEAPPGAAAANASGADISAGMHGPLFELDALKRRRLPKSACWSGQASRQRAPACPGEPLGERRTIHASSGFTHTNDGH